MDLYAAAAFWARKPAWFACDVEFEGRIWYRVGVRFKGNSTLAFSTGQTHKLPLRLDFDEFEDAHPAIDDQRFFGFKQLSTVNQIADPSFLRQKLAADLFRRAGVPAPRTAFYRFSLDHGDGPIYMGLYTVTEVPREPLLDDVFGDDGGTLYKCDGDGARFAEFHPESFHRKTNRDSDDYGDVEAFIAALNGPQDDPAAWRAALEATFDVDGFLRYWALNQAMVNWDTYGALAHNYYLYGDPTDDGRLAWLAWDFDLAFEGEADLSMMDAGPEWPLLHRLARDPIYMDRYRALLRETIDGAFEPEATVAEIERLRALIEPHVIGPMGEQPRFTALASPDDFPAAVDDLAGHVRRRAQSVEAWLDGR